MATVAAGALLDDGISPGRAGAAGHDRDIHLPAGLLVRDEFPSVGLERNVAGISGVGQLYRYVDQSRVPPIAAQPGHLQRRVDRHRGRGRHGDRRAGQRQVARPAGRANAAADPADDRAGGRRLELPLALQRPVRIRRRAAASLPSAGDPLAVGPQLGARLGDHRRRLAKYPADGVDLPGRPAIVASGVARRRPRSTAPRRGTYSGRSSCRCCGR